MDPQPEIHPGLPDPSRPQPAGWWGTVHERFRRWAGSAPERPAVVEDEGTWTYGELARESALLAERLREAGVGCEDVVALHTGRSAALVRGMLGTLEAGAAFLVLDPAHPPRYLAACLATAHPAAWVAAPAAGPVPAQVGAALAELPLRARIDLEEEGPPASGRAGGDPVPVGPDHLAYVAFTSGTTGPPLGVAGTHRPLSHFFAWSAERFAFTPDDRFALLSGLAHDPVLRDVFTPLWNGAALWIPRLRGPADHDRLAGWLTRAGATAVHLTPALGRVLVAGAAGRRLPALRHAFFGGDALDPGLVRDFQSLAPNAILVSYYGTTETPQAPAWHVLEPGDAADGAGPVPLGRGIEGAQLLVLRNHRELAPVGEIGEIAVRTPYLARGYLTPVGRFRPSPWSGEPGDRLFPTGDLGRFREDGSVVFAGRIGRQVQVRGLRVEPEGVERSLLEHPAVAAAAVVPVSGGPGGETSLAAFVVPRTPEAPDLVPPLRRHLAARLPEAAVPTAFHLLDRLPLRPGGKVDLPALVRRAGAAPREEADAGEGPRTETEALLAGLWAEVLGRDGAFGRTEHFFEAGGHSLAAVRLISRVRQVTGLELSLDRLLATPTLEGMARVLEGTRRGAGAATLPPVVPGPPGAPPELSPAQRRLWFLYRLDPSSPAYNLCDAFRLEGPVAPTLLARAFHRVVARHEPLRTLFPAAGAEPRPRVVADPRVELPVVDLRGLPTGAGGGEARHLGRRFAARPFDLEGDREPGALLRLLLVRLGADRHLLLVAVHHLAVDGWSFDLLYREVGDACRVLSAGRRWCPSRLPVRYADFAVWQRRLAEDPARREVHMAYWRSRLADLPTVELATDRPRRWARTGGGRLHRFHLPPETSRGLGRLARASGATPFIALLAAFHLLLARHTGADDVTVGFPLANRRRPELEGLVGFFVHTAALRERIVADGGREVSFRGLLGRVRDAVLEAHAHQDLPFERVVEALMPERELTQNPLFQTAFALRYGPEPRPDLPGAAVTRVSLDPPGARFDLEVHVSTAGPADGPEAVEGPIEGSIEGQALYDPALFDAATVGRLFRHYRTLAAAAAACPDAPVGALPLLAPGERHQLLEEWGRPPAAGATGPAALVRRFAERAAEAPDAVAVVDGDGATQLSYGDLAARAATLAARLRTAGVRAGDPVVLYLGRSLDLVTATLGALAAGATPLSVDPANPPERVAQILEGAFTAAASRVILTWESLVHRLPIEPTTPGTTVLVDPGTGRPGQLAEGLPPVAPPADPDRLGFAVATSGSTGRPKIVELPQRGLAALIDCYRRTCGSRLGTRHSMVAAPGFDASVCELWTALGNGATLELPPPYAAMDWEAVARWLAERRVEVGFLPTPLAEAFLAGTDGLSHRLSLGWLVTGGEALRARPPAGATFSLLNAYGPAEATVIATWGPVAPEGEGLPALGRALPGVVLVLLDTRLRPVPAGAPGEICLGGPGLALGYRGQPSATAAPFVPDPWTGRPGERLYRTGDLGRFRPDGTLEFLGRLDQQVKIRGYRIEPGEVEALLKEHPEVAEAAVLVHGGPGGGKRLVAFVSGKPVAGRPAWPGRDGGEGERRRVEHWRRLYDRIYWEPAAPRDRERSPGFDFRGWNSSFTGEPIPAALMRQWLEATVTRILTLSPRRVLEIGCGTGLVLSRVAPRCESYVGTDFSREVLAALERRLTTGPRLPAEVRLLRREARDFTGIPRGAFDLVVLNSVVQYFPSLEYLVDVLRGAVAAAGPGGALFLGDVRSLPLLETQCASEELHRAGPELTAGATAALWAQIRGRVRRRLLDEEELLLDPRLFLALERELPRIAAVDVEPRRGQGGDELTRFRYDVTLHLDRPSVGEPVRPLEPRWLEWGREVGSLEDLARVLTRSTTSGRPAALLVVGVPNARLVADLERRRRLFGTRTEPGAEGPSGRADPEDLLDLGRRTGHRARISWARWLPDGAFDALFVPRATAAGLPPGAPVADGRSVPFGPPERLASDPLAPEHRRRAVLRLRAYLEERLPRYMVPAEIVLLAELPLSPNGKLDRRALARRASERRGVEGAGRDPAPPGCREERRIAAVWSELLEVETVGLRDDFFLLGGHSLLVVAVTERIEGELGVRLPLAEFFRDPTVAGLARAVRRREVAEAAAGEPGP